MIAALQEMARGSDVRGAVPAIRGLGRIGGLREVVDLLGLLIHTQDEEVTDAAMRAVVSIGQRVPDRGLATETIFAAYDSAQGTKKAVLIGALAEIGGDRALAELTRSTSSSDPGPKTRRREGARQLLVKFSAGPDAAQCREDGPGQGNTRAGAARLSADRRAGRGDAGGGAGRPHRRGAEGGGAARREAAGPWRAPRHPNDRYQYSSRQAPFRTRICSRMRRAPSSTSPARAVETTATSLLSREKPPSPPSDKIIELTKDDAQRAEAQKLK